MSDLNGDLSTPGEGILAQRYKTNCFTCGTQRQLNAQVTNLKYNACLQFFLNKEPIFCLFFFIITLCLSLLRNYLLLLSAVMSQALKCLI